MFKDEPANTPIKQLISELNQQHPSHLDYETLDVIELENIYQLYSWISEPINKASQHVLQMPFFKWIKQLTNIQDFKCVAEQLYYHSATFPKVIGLMLGNTPMSENHMMPFYAKHAFGEADHHYLLLKWMLKHKLIAHQYEINEVNVTLATNACINLAYRLAIERDRGLWVAAINCGIERCSNDFFKIVAPKMQSLDAGDIYFDVHVEADEHHSIMGLKYIEIEPEDFETKDKLVLQALEGISLWAAMLHSWIGINYLPLFDIDGNLLNPTP